MFGFWEKPEQHRLPPAVDPGLAVSCPLCMEPVAGKPVYINQIVRPGDSRLYFYRVHRSCYHSASEEDELSIQAVLNDNGDN